MGPGALSDQWPLLLAAGVVGVMHPEGWAQPVLQTFEEGMAYTTGWHEPHAQAGNTVTNPKSLAWKSQWLSFSFNGQHCTLVMVAGGL